MTKNELELIKEECKRLAQEINGTLRGNMLKCIRIGWPLVFGVVITFIVSYLLFFDLRKYDIPDENWPEIVSNMPV